MFSVTSFILAFFSGILGCLLGGTQTFICTGFIGIVVAIFNYCGMDTTFMNDTVLNTLFLPCIIFNGAGFATAYASKNHPIRGVETGRSLAFTNDARVLLSGGIAGVLGYMIYAFALYYHFPVDQGALSVIIVGILGRYLYNKEKKYNKTSIQFLKERKINYWLFQFLLALAVSATMAFIAKETGLYTIGFSISAFLLIFAMVDSSFPATHHTTLITGYAYMTTHNIMISIIFGIIAHFIGLIFGYILNTDCGTHIDPPAIAIGSLSLIIFTLF